MLCLAIVSLLSAGSVAAAELTRRDHAPVASLDVAESGDVIAYESRPRSFLGEGDDAALYEVSQIVIETDLDSSLNGAQTVITRGLGGGRYSNPGLSDDGRFVFFLDSESALLYRSPSVDPPAPELIASDFSDHQYRVSRDGSRIVYRSGKLEITALDISSGSSASFALDVTASNSTREPRIAAISGDRELDRVLIVVESASGASPPAESKFLSLVSYRFSTGEVETIIGADDYAATKLEVAALSADGQAIAYVEPHLDTDSSAGFNYGDSIVHVRGDKRRSIRAQPPIDNLQLSPDGTTLLYTMTPESTSISQVMIWSEAQSSSRLISGNSPGRAADGNSYSPVLFNDGTAVYFQTEAHNLETPGPQLVATNLSEFTIDGSATGLWYNAAQSVHGFNVVVPRPEQMVIFWFAHDFDGEPVWLYADGTIAGETASLEVFISPTGTPPTAFDPDSTSLDPIGLMTFRAIDCESGEINWSIDMPGFGDGQLDVEKLAGSDVGPCIH